MTDPADEQQARPSEAPDLKEMKLLQAARQLFLEEGYAATSMDQVAQRASASKTTLYTRFSSKEALFKAVVKAECEAFGMIFDLGDFATLEFEAALNEIARRFVDLVYSPQALRIEQIVAAEGARFPELVAMYVQEGPEAVSASVAEYFSHAAGRGLIVATDPALTAEMFLSLIKNCMAGPRQMVWGLLPDEAARTKRLSAAIGLFLNGVRAR